MKSHIHTWSRTLVLTLVPIAASLVGCSDDSSTGPEMSAPPIVSAFEDGTEGWGGFGDYDGITTSRTRPVQGSYLRGFDRAEGVTWYFAAPNRYEGDLGRYYGGSLTYFMKSGFADGAEPVGSDYFGAPDVVIGSERKTLVYRLPTVSYPNDREWREYTVTMSPAPGWRVNETGERATEADMREVLADVQYFRIRGEYLSGRDYAQIDEIVLSR